MLFCVTTSVWFCAMANARSNLRSASPSRRCRTARSAMPTTKMSLRNISNVPGGELQVFANSEERPEIPLGTHQLSVSCCKTWLFQQFLSLIPDNAVWGLHTVLRKFWIWVGWCDSIPNQFYVLITNGCNKHCSLIIVLRDLVQLDELIHLIFINLPRFTLRVELIQWANGSRWSHNWNTLFQRKRLCKMTFYLVADL